MKTEGNIIKNWIEIHGDPQIEIKVLNELVDKLCEEIKLLREELAYEKRTNTLIAKQ